MLTSLASLLVGAAMFGALMFLPQYLQIVKGMSPTGSGLMTLPLVMALLVSSIMIGRFVSRTGRWKVFPVAGMLLVALGLFLLSRLHVDSSLLVVALDNAVLGVGLGASMQILILAAQNAVGRTDLASVTSGVTFFRSLGGAVGVAAFGAILSNRLTTELVSLARAAKLPLTGGSVPSLGSPEAIHRLPAPVLEIILEAFTRAMSAVFLVGVPIAVLGAVAALLLKEIPLRSAQAAAAPAPVSK